MRRLRELSRIVTAMLLAVTAINAQSGSSTSADNTTTTTPIKHVVVVFQENVSFDHYFATYPNATNPKGEPAFTADANTPSVNGLTAGLLTNNPNSAQPFRLDRSQPITCDQDHNYPDEQKAFNGGLMNQFVQDVGVGNASCDINGLGAKIVMGYYDGNTVTALWNYAQSFAMSDNSFSTTFGPSTPGALNLIAGNTHGATAGDNNPQLVAGSIFGDPRPATDDCTPKTVSSATMSGKNVGDLLNAKGVSWGWFQGGFRPSATSNGIAACGSSHNNVAGASVRDYIPHHEPFQYYQQTSNPHHLAPSSTGMIGLTDQANHQYDIADFWNALSANNLPAVTYLKAAAYQDGHAAYSDPLDEQTFLVTVINGIEQSPVWKNTAIIVAYDDSDGWYDHVMPPILNSSATAQDFLNGSGSCGGGAPLGGYNGRCGYGPRQPFLVISPFAKQNFVDHTTTDQSSILRFIEDNWALGRIGDGSFDAIAGPLTQMFNFQNTSLRAVILDPATGLPQGPASTTAASASPKSIATTAKQITLDASRSTSLDLKPLSFSWTLAPGSPSAAIIGSQTANPTVQFSGPGAYSFILTVIDAEGNMASDTASVFFQGR